MKKAILISIGILSILALLGIGIFALGSSSGLVVYADGNKICEIEEKQIFDAAGETVAKRLKEAGLTANGVDITFGYHNSLKHDYANAAECADMLCSYYMTDCVRAFGINCDGKCIAVCRSYGYAEKIIDELKRKAISELPAPDNGTEIEITNDFEIISLICSKATVSDIRDIYAANMLEYTEGSDGFISGTVINCGLSGTGTDSYGIAKSADGSGVDIKLRFGSTDSEVEHTNIIKYTYTRAVPYETEYVDSPKYYVGERADFKAGENGLEEVTVVLSRSPEGKEEKRIISVKTIAEPKNAVVYQGTKQYPTVGPTGSFIWPLKYYKITSYYGYRLGYRFPHTGLDLGGNKAGTPIYAADGGTVIFAGDGDSYGNLVKIEHDQDTVSYYGHMLEILVSEGDIIYKGQLIGLVGSTGNSTGPHLHFQINIGGKTVDPMIYLP